jgi:hypothetical protein
LKKTEKPKVKTLSAFFILISLQAKAEYRVFILEITSSDGNSVRQIESTLDPDQYPGYHPLKAGEKIRYTQTWMCRGRTGSLPTCPNPRSLAGEPTAATTSPGPPDSATSTPEVKTTPP